MSSTPKRSVRSVSERGSCQLCRACPLATVHRVIWPLAAAVSSSAPSAENRAWLKPPRTPPKLGCRTVPWAKSQIRPWPCAGPANSSRRSGENTAVVTGASNFQVMKAAPRSKSQARNMPSSAPVAPKAASALMSTARTASACGMITGRRTLRPSSSQASREFRPASMRRPWLESATLRTLACALQCPSTRPVAKSQCTRLLRSAVTPRVPSGAKALANTCARSCSAWLRLAKRCWVRQFHSPAPCCTDPTKACSPLGLRRIDSTPPP